MPTEVYQKLLARMVNQYHDDWVRRFVNVADVVENYRQAHAEKLPQYWQSYCAPARWRRWCLAYMYINIKTKCWSDMRKSWSGMLSQDCQLICAPLSLDV